MRLHRLLSDDSAVSPVIGVILMVAITVILAAVIGTFVLGLGGDIGQTAPNANFQFDYDSANSQLTVTHDGGDAIDANELYVGGNQWGGTTDGGMVTAGHSDTVSAGEDETVRVVWQDSDSDTTQTIAVWND